MKLTYLWLNISSHQCIWNNEETGGFLWIKTIMRSSGEWSISLQYLTTIDFNNVSAKLRLASLAKQVTGSCAHARTFAVLPVWDEHIELIVNKKSIMVVQNIYVWRLLTVGAEGLLKMVPSITILRENWRGDLILQQFLWVKIIASSPTVSW